MWRQKKQLIQRSLGWRNHAEKPNGSHAKRTMRCRFSVIETLMFCMRWQITSWNASTDSVAVALWATPRAEGNKGMHNTSHREAATGPAPNSDQSPRSPAIQIQRAIATTQQIRSWRHYPCTTTARRF